MAVIRENRGRRAVFLDRDGTLVENVPYNVDPARVRLADGAARAIRAFRDAGFAVFVVSNQSGVARGMFGETDVEMLHHAIHRRLAEEGESIDQFYYCPHHPEGVVAQYALECDCRKPSPGMILRGAREHGIELGESWLIGDILDDIEAGRRAGCRTVLIDNGGETEWRLSPLRTPHATVPRLRDAPSILTHAGGVR